LVGIVKEQGLTEGPLEQEAPLILQLENDHPELGVAVTVC